MALIYGHAGDGGGGGVRACVLEVFAIAKVALWVEQRCITSNPPSIPPATVSLLLPSSILSPTHETESAFTDE